MDILGAMYTVSGYSMRSADGMKPGQVVNDLDGAKPNQTHLGKYRGLLTFDDVMQSGDVLMPNQKWSKTFAFAIRGDRLPGARSEHREHRRDTREPLTPGVGPRPLGPVRRIM